MASAKPNPAVDALLQQAVALHRAGRTAPAERLYDEILRIDPSNANALNLKGLIAADHGRHEEALGLIERAIAAMPNFADLYFNKGNALSALERNDEALHAYDAAVSRKDAYADARLNAGRLFHKIGRLNDAIAGFRAMVKVCPQDGRGFYNLGVCLTEALSSAGPEEEDKLTREAVAAFECAVMRDANNADVHFAFAALHFRRGAFGKAIPYAERAIHLKPAWPEAYCNLGEYLRQEKRHDEAVAAFQTALALRPSDRDLKYNLANALYDAKDLDGAEKLFLELIAADKDFVKPYVNLGNIRRDRNRFDDAMDLFEKALRMDPTIRIAYANLGTCLFDRGWYVSGLIMYEKALSLKDDNPTTRYFRGTAYLQAGRLSEGWVDYELRFDAPKEANVRRVEPPPYWRGEDLHNKKILVWTEQGKGDEILYSGMIPQLISRGAYCLIESSPAMAPIFARSFPEAKVVAWDVAAKAVTPAAGIDYQIDLPGLGQFLRTDFSNFPKHRGYLEADPARTAALRRSYVERAKGRRIVGLSWRSTNPRVGTTKTAELVNFAPILEIPGIMFVNLQYGDCGAEISAVRERLGIDVFHDPAIDPLADLDGSFAQIAAMDLVVSTPNTTVHTAGSLNVPVWMLSPHGKGSMWYWFLRREDSPWYPSVRIFRARKASPLGHWEDEPVRRIADELSKWVAASDTH